MVYNFLRINYFYSESWRSRQCWFFTTSAIGGMGLIQQANAAQCNRDVVAVCGVCVNANVIGRMISQQCNQ